MSEKLAKAGSALFPVFCGLCAFMSGFWLPPRMDWFVPGIVMAFSGGMMLVMIQKIPPIILLLKMPEQRNASKDFKSFEAIDLCSESEIWSCSLVVSAMILFLELIPPPDFGKLALFFLAGALAAFFKARRRCRKEIEKSFGKSKSQAKN